MNLRLLRLLFVKRKPYLYNNVIGTKQLVQRFMLSCTWSESFIFLQL